MSDRLYLHLSIPDESHLEDVKFLAREVARSVGGATVLKNTVGYWVNPDTGEVVQDDESYTIFSDLIGVEFEDILPELLPDIAIFLQENDQNCILARVGDLVAYYSQDDLYDLMDTLH